mgnify:CR=1 FL=1|jgi:hypothetical protein
MASETKSLTAQIAAILSSGELSLWYFPVCSKHGLDKNESCQNSLASTENNENSNREYQIVELSQNELLVEFQENSPKNPPNWAFVRTYLYIYI